MNYKSIRFLKIIVENVILLSAHNILVVMFYKSVFTTSANILAIYAASVWKYGSNAVVIRSLHIRPNTFFLLLKNLNDFLLLKKCI